MGTRDPRVDAYITKSADFAKPILTSIRDIVHSACPECEEKVKWGAPFFDYKGMLCGMAAFKEHCAMIFWKSKLIRNCTMPLTQWGTSAGSNRSRTFRRRKC